MRLTDDEYEVVTNIWGIRTPDNLDDIETEQLLEMLVQVARAVGASIEDGDGDALEILESLEGKIERELENRLTEE